MASFDVSLAIMAKNEEENLPAVLSELFEVLKKGLGGTSELLLIDGYSEDGTARIAEERGIRVVKAGGGKGAGIRKALEVCRGRYILFIDADHSHVAADIPRLIRAIKEEDCDMVIASRITGGSEELRAVSWDNILRLIGNRLGTFWINLRWGSKLTDVQNGFRIIKRETALELGLTEDSFPIEQEMVMKCLKRKKKITEIPAFERKRLYGDSKIRKGTEFWKYLWCLLRNM
jgi:glycosyltransferase involved in cell wall biosynthesis